MGTWKPNTDLGWVRQWSSVGSSTGNCAISSQSRLSRAVRNDNFTEKVSGWLCWPIFYRTAQTLPTGNTTDTYVGAVVSIHLYIHISWWCIDDHQLMRQQGNTRSVNSQESIDLCTDQKSKERPNVMSWRQSIIPGHQSSNINNHQSSNHNV